MLPNLRERSPRLPSSSFVARLFIYILLVVANIRNFSYGETIIEQPSKIISGSQILDCTNNANSIKQEDQKALTTTHDACNQSKKTIQTNQQSTDFGAVSNVIEHSLSQENLLKLLPSLIVIPEQIVCNPGETVHFACTTNDLDPEPEPAELRWSFWSEHFRDQKQMSNTSRIPKEPTDLSIELNRLKHGIEITGNVLTISNISWQHLGLYTCKFHLIDYNITTEADGELSFRPEQTTNTSNSQIIPTNNYNDTNQSQPGRSGVKTKVAHTGSNIELRCQVNGLGQQPDTSWSRDGKELPKSSLQIGHNLWIQNLSQADEGLYLCSARSNEPNHIIQARINLLVRASVSNSNNASTVDGTNKFKNANLTAKIVASKSSLTIGDSVTLECTIRQEINQTSSTDSSAMHQLSAEELEHLEQQVQWTNGHSSNQSLFQDNVYIQNNLLIIYDVKLENLATYRCNYNNLFNHVDYHMLRLFDFDGNPIPPLTDKELVQPTSSPALAPTNASLNQNLNLESVNIHNNLSLNCPPVFEDKSPHISAIKYQWTFNHVKISNQENAMLNLSSLNTHQAGLYQCQLRDKQNGQILNTTDHIVQVRTSSVKFVQQPVSFITLSETIWSNYDKSSTEIEMKFYPEEADGLLLFGGIGEANNYPSGDDEVVKRNDDGATTNQNTTITTTSIDATSLSRRNDFILIGLNRGQLELQFELGDGVTTMRSSSKLNLNRWHRVIIERNRRNITMWLDGHRPQSCTYAGKFLDLDLDSSVLFVGGHQVFSKFNFSSDDSAISSSQIATSSKSFHGFTGGFQGCVSQLRINGLELDLKAKNRTVSIGGVCECDKNECTTGQNRTIFDCHSGYCQVDRSSSSLYHRQRLLLGKRNRVSMASSDLRCICGPHSSGLFCEKSYSGGGGGGGGGSIAVVEESSIKVEEFLIDQTTTTTSNLEAKVQTQNKTTEHSSNVNNGTLEHIANNNNNSQPVKPAESCQRKSTPCNLNGTADCQSLTSTSYKCHCRLGFMGVHCEQTVAFTNGTSIKFNQSAYLQFQLFNLNESRSWSSVEEQAKGWNAGWTAASSGELMSFAEQINISFTIQTRSSFGLLFYIGANEMLSPPEQLNKSAKLMDKNKKLIPRSIEESTMATVTTTTTTTATNQQSSIVAQQTTQLTKSFVANLLARLANENRSAAGSPTRLGSKVVNDFLAIALIDGHVELSFELGSGPAIIRSSRRINDGYEHKLEITRRAKYGSLVIDGTTKYEGRSPGQLHMLNTEPDIYLGGLPLFQSSFSSSALRMSTFTGCISQLYINNLPGPLDLIHSNQWFRLRSTRNLLPCSPMSIEKNSETLSEHFTDDGKSASGTMTTKTTIQSPTTTTTETSLDSSPSNNQSLPSTSTRKPAYSSSTSNTEDDSDDLRAR